MIVNLQNSDQGGSHWQSLCKQGANKYYFCSFGSDPPIEVVNYLKPPIMSSTFQIQDFDDTICGELSLLVLYLLDKGIYYESIILVLVD